MGIGIYDTGGTRSGSSLSGGLRISVRRDIKVDWLVGWVGWSRSQMQHTYDSEKPPNHKEICNLKGQLEDFKVDLQERNENFIRRFQRLLSLPDWTRFENPSCPITQMQHLLNEWKSYRDDEAETEQLILRKLYALE